MTYDRLPKISDGLSYRGPRHFSPPPPPTAHYADANETEIETNGRMLHDLEFAFGPGTQVQPDLAAAEFVAFLDNAGKLRRARPDARNHGSRLFSQRLLYASTHPEMATTAREHMSMFILRRFRRLEINRCAS
jgi:hypothetical protein